MTKARIPGGVLAPVATTFDANGDLDLVAYKNNMAFYAGSALDGVVIMGSNGEFALLDADEKVRLIAAGVEGIGGKKVVMAGTGAESTRASIALTKQAAALGVDFALVVTPHYYKPKYDNAAVLRHYQTIAEASPIPVIVYIMTTYTGVDLASSLVAELSRHPNIVGVKDSAGNAPKVAEMVAYSDKEFGVLAGSANFLYPALCLGATGGILALANLAPTECKELYQLWQAGEHDKARELQFRLLAPNAAVTAKHGIPGLKVALEHVGLNGGAPRPPLLPLNDKDAADVRATLDKANLGRVR
jgi:4-hydroxy-2-oxoglutarate aldolase